VPEETTRQSRRAPPGLSKKNIFDILRVLSDGVDIMDSPYNADSQESIIKDPYENSINNGSTCSISSSSTEEGAIDDDFTTYPEADQDDSVNPAIQLAGSTWSGLD
jgi:hypothetical protein